MQKIRKILRAVSEKTALPTNYYQQHQSHRTYSKPFIKIIGILLMMSRFCKSSDETIIQISFLFLINPSICFTGTYLKPSQYLR